MPISRVWSVLLLCLEVGSVCLERHCGFCLLFLTFCFSLQTVLSRLADIVSTFDSPESVRLGECERIDEIMIGEDKLIRFSGCKGGQACTIVLRGASSHLLEEAERSLHDALAVLQQTLLHPERTLGGGCAEMIMAEAVDELVPQVAGKKSLAVAAFARALRQMPTIIADNAGLDGAELVSQLRAAHHNGQKTAGLDM